MSYYRIRTSDKRAVLSMAKPVINGNTVYFFPFNGFYKILESTNKETSTQKSLSKSTYSPKNILWFLKKIGFELNYNEEKKYVEISIPKDTEKRDNLFSTYNYFFVEKKNFKYLDSLFSENDKSIYLLTYRASYGLLDDPLYIDAPNVVDGLILPDIKK